MNEFKKIKNSKRAKVCSIDGYYNDRDISQHFAELYKDLYNKTDTTNLLQNEYHLLSSQVLPEDLNLLKIISPGKIYEMIIKLDRGRCDSLYKSKSDAFVVGKDILSEYLALLFESVSFHGY